MMNRPGIDPIGCAFVLAVGALVAWLLRTFLHLPLVLAVVLGFIAACTLIPAFIVAGLMLWERWHHRGEEDN